MALVTPQPLPDAVSPIVNDVRGYVTSGFGNAQGYASSSFGQAQSFLSALQSASASLGNLPSIDTALTPVAAAIQAYSPPEVPTAPTNLALNLPAAPQPLAIPTIDAVALPPAPSIEVQAPTLDLPAVPSPLSVSLPTAPTLTDVPVPTVPDITLPDVPSLLGYSIPAAPTLTLPSFSATLSQAPTAPANTFAFTDADYESTFLDSIRATLQVWADGASTGLSPAVEQQTFQRLRERNAATAAASAINSIRAFASRGFRKPPGALARELDAAAQQAQDTDLGSSRDIAIASADLEQKNRQFAIQQAVASEAPLIQYKSLFQQRAFEAAKYAQEVAIQVFGSQVQLFDAEVRAYETEARVLEVRIKAELSKLDVMRAQLEAQKLIGELNLQQVELYKGRLAGVQAIVDIFKARIDGANLSLQARKLLLDGFATQVQAFDSAVRAKAAEYQGYESQIRGQNLKVELFKGTTDGNRNMVQAWAALAEALTKAKDSEIKARIEAPVAAKKVESEIYGVLAQAEVSRAGNEAKVFDSRVQLFGSQSKAENERVGSEVEVYKADVTLASAEAQLRLQAAVQNLSKLTAQAQLLAENIRGGAQVAAQLAAAALSSVHLSAGISASGSAGFSASASNSTSNSASNSDSNAVSNSTSNSTSNTTAYELRETRELD